jgi:hypothetical protein
MITLDEMESSRVNTINNPLTKVSSETGRVRLRNTDIFIQVKENSFGPIDVRLLNQRFEELELRGSGGGDQMSFTPLGEGLPNDTRSLICGRLGKFQF